MTLLDKSNVMAKIKLSKFDAFRVGEKPTLAQVLSNREKRVELQEKLTKEYCESVVISFKCNIPGPIKNNEVVRYIFNQGEKSLNNCILANSWEVRLKKEIDAITGPELIMVIDDVSAKVIKEKMIAIESEDSLARLYDFDVLYFDENVVSVSRETLGYESRKCLICECDAKECARSRKHSLEELHDKIVLYISERDVVFYESKS